MRELLETHLGRAVCLLIALTYLVRAVEEPILFDFSPWIFATCLAVGWLYAVLPFLPARPGGQA